MLIEEHIFGNPRTLDSSGKPHKTIKIKRVSQS